MGLLSALFIIAGRFIVKIFITVFGWAMVIFFGQIPEEKNKKLSIIALLSLVWVILIVGISYPALTKAFYDYIPDKNLKRMISVFLESIGILLIPVAVGEISVFIQGKEKKEAKDFLRAVIIGYYYSFVMGISMLLMLIMAPIITLKRFLRRQEVASMPVIISDDRVKEVFGKVKRGLDAAGFHVLMGKPDAMMNLPVFLIRWMLKDLLNTDITRNLKLQGEGFRIYLNATDILVVGRKNLIEKIQIHLDLILTFDPCFMTWGEESHKLEKEAYFLYHSFQNKEKKWYEIIDKLEELKYKAEHSGLEFREWQTVLRKISAFEMKVIQYGWEKIK